MKTPRHILDNKQRKVVDYLREQLKEADTFRLVSAYFSIYGYDLLSAELDGLKDVRFLFGEPNSAEDVDPAEGEPKAFELLEKNMSPLHQLQQKKIAKECAQWVKKKNVQIRSMKKNNFLHGKIYHMQAQQNGAVIVGSSNFTQRGLGGSQISNLEINVASQDPSIRGELALWFDQIWKDKKLTKDVKNEVLASLERIGAEHAPELIYFKVLYALFFEKIKARENQEQRLKDIQLSETKIWNKLFDFQKEGVKTAIQQLEQYNGCILADSVGLGKTYTALAVIKYFELLNKQALVLVPRKLSENWSLYREIANHPQNPFAGDKFGYNLLFHTDLSRESGRSQEVDLANFNWGNFDLLVIDESHNFRNATSSRKNKDGTIERYSRYDKLLKDVIGRSVNTKVLLLSATPVNTSLIDLRNQVNLMAGGQKDFYNNKLGIRNIHSLFQQAQRAFRSWEQKRGDLRGGEKTSAYISRH